MFKTIFTSNGVAGHLKSTFDKLLKPFLTFIWQYVARDPQNSLKFVVFKKLEFPQNVYLDANNAVLKIQPRSFWQLPKLFARDAETKNPIFLESIAY